MNEYRNRLIQNLNEFSELKKKLFQFYKRQECKLARKSVPGSGGFSFGFQLKSIADTKFEKATGASIGEDELRILFELASLTSPKHCFIIGNAFGFSTFWFSICSGAKTVTAIDNWGEGEASEKVRLLNERIIRDEELNNVQIYTGTSPKDNDSALNHIGDEKLSILFIDGMHNNKAAYADFNGTKHHLNETSIVLWHNTPATIEAFRKASKDTSTLFDSFHILRTYGQLGIFFNKEKHPTLDIYLRENNLIWRDWELQYLAASSANEIKELRKVRYSFLGKILSKLL